LWPSGVQPIPLTKPPQILPPVIQSETSKPPSPHTLSRMADGLNIAWRGGNVAADRRTTKAIENAKNIRDKSISLGTNHTLRILGKCNQNNEYIKPVCNSHERGAVTSQLDQTSCSPCFEFTRARMPPKHMYVKPLPGRPPITWSKITDDPMYDVSPSDNSVLPQSSGMSVRSNQQTAYKKVRFDSVSPQVNSVSAHKEVSLNSILLQISGGLQDQARENNVAPQSIGVSVQSNQQTAYKKDLTVSCCKSMACQHTRRSVSTVSHCRSVAGCRIKQEIKPSRVPPSKPTRVLTRCGHSHRSS
jgi:hypothetical protein